jgi:hypothetical protein
MKPNFRQGDIITDGVSRYECIHWAGERCVCRYDDGVFVAYLEFKTSQMYLVKKGPKR